MTSSLPPVRRVLAFALALMLLPAAAGASQCLRPGDPLLVVGQPEIMADGPDDAQLDKSAEPDRQDPFAPAARGREGTADGAPTSPHGSWSIPGTPATGSACRATASCDSSWYARRSWQRPAYYATAPPAR